MIPLADTVSQRSTKRKKMGASLRNAASVAPRRGNFIAWAQSPNGRWMLLAGHWQRKASAEQYLRNAGYRLVPFALVLPEIERQMAERMENSAPGPQDP